MYKTVILAKGTQISTWQKKQISVIVSGYLSETYFDVSD